MSRISMMYSPINYKGDAVSYTKTFKKDGSKKSYDNAYKANMVDINIDTIDDLKDVMTLCNEVDGCLTGGQPKKDYGFPIRRLIYNDEKNNYKATIKQNSQFSVLVIDVDDKPNPYSYKDFDNHLGYILTQLEMVMPECLETDFIYQLSSSAGTRDTSNCHLFFLLDDSFNYDTITTVFDNFNKKAIELNADIQFDNSVNTRTQPIYVTNPIFEEPTDNPILKRVFTVVSDKRQLTLPKWVLEPKQEVERGVERELELTEMSDEIKDYHKESAINAFKAASSSSVGLGRFVKYLKLKKYTYRASEALWEMSYDGDNYTLVAPTTAHKHTYNKFRDTWDNIPFEEPEYFNIKLPIILTTDSRLGETLLPDWSRQSLLTISKMIIQIKKDENMKRLPKVKVYLDSKVSSDIKNHITMFAKDNMMRWRLV